MGKKCLINFKVVLKIPAKNSLSYSEKSIKKLVIVLTGKLKNRSDYFNDLLENFERVSSRNHSGDLCFLHQKVIVLVVT